MCSLRVYFSLALSLNLHSFLEIPLRGQGGCPTLPLLFRNFLFIHSFSTSLLSSHPVLGTVLYAGGVEVTNTAKSLCHGGAVSKKSHKSINEIKIVI